MILSIFVFIIGIIMAGTAHWIRDASIWQRDANTFLESSGLQFCLDSIFNGNEWRDLWHSMDSTMRHGAALIGVGVVLMPVPWFFWPVFFLLGLWGSEWIFGILYHCINPDPGHRDFRTFKQQIKIMLRIDRGKSYEQH